MRRTICFLVLTVFSNACGSKSPATGDVAAPSAPATAAAPSTPTTAAPDGPDAAAPSAAPVAPPSAAPVAPRLVYGEAGLETEGFPAITPDGKILVDVRSEGGERVGQLTTSLVFVDVASGKEEASVLSIESLRPGEDPTAAELDAKAAKVRDAIAAGTGLLSKHAWVSMSEPSGKTVAYEAPNLVVRGADGKALREEAHPDWAPVKPAPCPPDKDPEDCDCEATLSIEDPREAPELGLLVFARVYTRTDCQPYEERDYPIVRLR